MTRRRTLFAIAALVGLTGLAPGMAVRAEVGKDKGQVTLSAGGTLPLPVVTSDQQPTGPNPARKAARSGPAANPPPDGTPCPSDSALKDMLGNGNRGNTGGSMVGIEEHPTYHPGSQSWSWPNPGGGPDFSAPDTGSPGSLDGSDYGSANTSWTPGEIPAKEFAVFLTLTQKGTIQNGVCVGDVWTTGTVAMGGPFPPPVPPAAAVAALPPGMANIAANVKKSWNIGTIGSSPTLPLPTFVNIPTCAWLNTGVPQVTTTITEEKIVPANNPRGSVNYTLRYTATVSPGPITWDFGDGINQGHNSGLGSNPQTAGMPTYNAVTQTWAPGGCTVYHAYPSVNDPGRMITASQNVTIGITVSYNNGIGLVGPQALPCDGAAFCNVPVGAADGWSSGPHPVMQIQGVPYFT